MRSVKANTHGIKKRRQQRRSKTHTKLFRGVASRGKVLEKKPQKKKTKNKMKRKIVALGVIVVMAVVGFAYTSSLRSEPALQRRRMDTQHHVPNADDDRYTRVVHHTYLYNIYSISNVPANNPKCIRHTHTCSSHC